ncbi:glucuronate isomerase [Litorimonas sp. RW-G-Af-16]|uniref:glucuronate isomerase n=1 Tax=Litorimonas sp. RW-G-Af-16 TaxID=3241168 RepID=UPI00390CB462
MTTSSHLHPDRLFPANPAQRDICRTLYASVKDFPIISPHGHTDPSWFAGNANFGNPAELLIQPDHYVLRMLYSQGLSYESLGLKPKDGVYETDPRKVWQTFAEHYYLFAGTPSRIWLDHVFTEVFGIDKLLTAETAPEFYDIIDAALKSDDFKPRALLDRFKIDLIATTEGALDDLRHHKAMVGSGYEHRVITTFRPDDVVDADKPEFADNLKKLSDLTGFDTTDWAGYLDALRARRAYFRDVGRATATDHGHPTARTENLAPAECQKLLDMCLAGKASAEERDMFRGQMLTEMAGMSLEDGMTMQIHPGSYRNHNPGVYNRFGADKGADIPMRVNYTQALQPLLAKHGNEAGLEIILFTLDESNYARELATLAGHYPCLRLGPPWWFHDSPQGMLRFRDQVTETAGFYNTAGFNDDTRAFLSIPARHDVARRMDSYFLSQLVCEHKITMAEAERLIVDLTYNLAVKAYKLPMKAKSV